MVSRPIHEPDPERDAFATVLGTCPNCTTPGILNVDGSCPACGMGTPEHERELAEATAAEECCDGTGETLVEQQADADGSGGGMTIEKCGGCKSCRHERD